MSASSSFSSTTAATPLMAALGITEDWTRVWIPGVSSSPSS